MYHEVWHKWTSQLVYGMQLNKWHQEIKHFLIDDAIGFIGPHHYPVVSWFIWSQLLPRHLLQRSCPRRKMSQFRLFGHAMKQRSFELHGIIRNDSITSTAVWATGEGVASVFQQKQRVGAKLSLPVRSLAYQLCPGSLFTNRRTSYRNISWSLEANSLGLTLLITLNLDRHLGSNAAEMPVKSQSDTIIVTSKLAASRHSE